MDSAPPFERKKSPELYVQPATTPRSSALCDLSPVCNYLNRNSWMKSDSCRGDDRRSLRNVAPSLPVPYHVKNYFSRNEFRLLHYLIRCGPRPGFLSLKFLSNSATFRKRARPTRRDATLRQKWILLLVNRARSTIVSRGNSRSRLFNNRLEELWQVS